MSRHYTNHALDRARERYNGFWGHEEIEDIWRRIRDGGALLIKIAGGEGHHHGVYVLTVEKVRVVAVVAMSETHKPCSIITFKPSDAIVAGATKAHKIRTGVMRKSNARIRRPREERARGLGDWRQEVEREMEA